VRLIELDWGESAQMGAVRVHCVPAQHFGALDRRARTAPVDGLVVEGPRGRFYHAGDTGYSTASVRSASGRTDRSGALPIGAYDPPEIMRFVHPIRTKRSRSGRSGGRGTRSRMHWGTFDLTDEPLDEPRAVAAPPADAANLGPIGRGCSRWERRGGGD